MQEPISIVSLSSISPLGITKDEIWQNYLNKKHFFTKKNGVWLAEIDANIKSGIDQLRASNHKYKSLDDSVLFAIYTSRKAVTDAKWKATDNFGINIGSSRGATSIFESNYQAYLDNNKVHPLTSPTTTLGNISSWVAHDLNTKGPEISHSITCSTSLHALLNGIAWINSGMCNKFLVGGSEAPLTPFTMAQMQALKIYSNSESSYPCRALDLNKTENTMILGEGAAVACLEKGNSNNAIAQIIGFGYGTEVLEHNASLSTEAECFQRSMRMALDNINPDDIDIIVTHTPGTAKGDKAEFSAIKKVFCNKSPHLTTNKTKVGHSLGTSGLLSVEMALLMLNHQKFLDNPFMEQSAPKKISKIMINAVGFGGNAVSIIVSK